MNRTYHSLTLFTLLLILLSSTIHAKKDSIFLCIDSMITIKHASGKEPPKLVYSYIDGKKTACMTEHALRSLLSQASFRTKELALQKRQKKTIERNAVFRGEKNLRNVDLRGMDLQGVNLSGADLTGAILESADLRNANLSNSKLHRTSLKNAYCKNTNFQGADFSQSTLRGVFLQNADLTNTTGLDIDNLSTAATFYKSKFDENIGDIIKESFSSKCRPPKGTWVPAPFESEE